MFSDFQELRSGISLDNYPSRGPFCFFSRLQDLGLNTAFAASL